MRRRWRVANADVDLRSAGSRGDCRRHRGGTTYGEYAQKTYGYANNGNLTAFEGVAQEYTDAAHPHAVTKLGGTQKYWYDGNGNATKRIASDGTYEFVYDAENQLTQLKKAGSVISTFKYDGDGNRIWEARAA